MAYRFGTQDVPSRLAVEDSVVPDFKLYLITDRKQITIPLARAVRLALEGGVKAIQLREKDMPVRQLDALAHEIRALTNEFGARLFINDHVDIAVAVEADGVHLGRESMPVTAARKVVENTMMIGVSTHSVDEARAAQAEGADFVTFGPIFETPAKAPYGPPLGLEALKEAKKSVDIPIFALGGIKSRNIGHALWCGAYGVSMISTIFGAEDIRRTAKNITDLIQIVDRAICIECGRR